VVALPGEALKRLLEQRVDVTRSTRVRRISMTVETGSIAAGQASTHALQVVHAHAPPGRLVRESTSSRSLPGASTTQAQPLWSPGVARVLILSRVEVMFRQVAIAGERGLGETRSSRVCRGAAAAFLDQHQDSPRDVADDACAPPAAGI
jgi:hypothetical protein